MEPVRIKIPKNKNKADVMTMDIEEVLTTLILFF